MNSHVYFSKSTFAKYFTDFVKFCRGLELEIILVLTHMFKPISNLPF